MDRIVPISWLNQILLLISVVTASLSIIIQEWFNLTTIPIYITILWAVLIIIVSIWFSCILLRFTLKATTPVNIKFINKWVQNNLDEWCKSDPPIKEKKPKSELTIENTHNDQDTLAAKNKCTDNTKKKKNKSKTLQRQTVISTSQQVRLTPKTEIDIEDTLSKISELYIDSWYKNISNDKAFTTEAQDILKQFLKKLYWQTSCIDKIKLTKKLTDVFLMHLKEYRRALKRVEKGISSNIADAYKYQHPGSRNQSALEHSLHRLVTILAQEFLQWELINSLPCKLVLSILSRKLLLIVDVISSPDWFYSNLLDLLQSTPQTNIDTAEKKNANGMVSTALADGMTSVTAAIIPRTIPKSESNSNDAILINGDNNNASTDTNSNKPVLHLEGLSVEHRGLWGDIIISDVDAEDKEETEGRISPVYEEPTDFATTIARLRNLLQQKSNATTPMQAEEKSYVLCEGSQFTNLSIPWTEMYTASDGSQQLVYCIQFDDVEQNGDLFETTTATVRRKYSNFIQLHTSLLEIPSICNIMSELQLPEGDRIEMESYLKTLCTRVANDCPPQLRHFLRPNSDVGKKADAVAPRLDRFLAKTMTGVFNTLKTVVPGFEMDQEDEVAPLQALVPLSDIPWRFVEDIKTRSLAVDLKQLVAERIDYCTDDTAYEAVDLVEGSGESELLSQWLETVNSSFDEELDDLDSNLTLTCAAVDLICEVLAGINSNNTLQQEAVVRWVKLIFGNISEPVIQRVILWISERIGNIFETSALENDFCQEFTNLKKDRLVKVLQSMIPTDLKLMFGENDTNDALVYLITSWETKKINLDLHIQFLDVLISELLISIKTNNVNGSL